MAVNRLRSESYLGN